MPSPLNFQSILLTLQHFWAEKGCLLWQPYYSQVGAGTMNPATALRVLGPEPWNVGYVEPSVRPDDGRYGDNPNRFQLHYQFQVILKPDPGNPQELYLQSLEALGINPREHDIRFVEDNWESPALGAWGLGWEVWLDGQEITQFTYFQQAGGQILDPVSVEITYGLDRILIALQHADAIWDTPWNDQISYGEVRRVEEREHSTYYFEVADVERQYELYKLYEEEANNALGRGLVLPAYDYLLKCSHTFNVLDARGAVGVTERQALFGRMRALARSISEVYVKQREALGFPWTGKISKIAGGGPERNLPLVSLIDDKPEPSISSPFILEIGTEEMPPRDLDDAINQLKSLVPKLLEDLRIDYRTVNIYATPRRLVVFIEDLAPFQSSIELTYKGPPVDRAYDSEGNLTQAAIGFARSKGVSPDILQIREIDKGKYVVAIVNEKGNSSSAILIQAIPNLIKSLTFIKPMRWDRTNTIFSRPIRWILALHGEHIIRFRYAVLDSGRATRSLRFREPDVNLIQSPKHYFETMERQGIILDVEKRKQVIREQVAALAAEVGGTIPDDPSLLDEVTHLVEAPTALRGTFPEEYLSLPREVLISVMKKHQRYFPIVRSEDVRSAENSHRTSHSALLPYFIAVRNGDDQHLDMVTEGNEHVIRARFADANFFVSNDLKRPLEDYLPRLDGLTFQAKLGSMLDKTRRIEDLIVALAPKAGLNPKEEAIARRAAHLCKADLVTEMVIEMTTLQGTMGKTYALRAGEPAPVAEAIYEHYLPRSAGDAVPKSRPGLVIGLADRLDSLVGLFAAGLAPTGNKDPFGLRRAALGLCQMLIAWDLNFDLRSSVRSAARRQPLEVSPETQTEVLDFITGRLRSWLLDEGYKYDVVDAVLAAQSHNPAPATRAVKELTGWVARDDWHEILPTYSRCVRITRDQIETFSVQPLTFVEQAEHDLYNALLEAESHLTPDTASPDTFLNAFLPMQDAVNRFFDAVLVMTEDESLRNNRLGLLQRIAALANGVADMSKLEGF